MADIVIGSGPAGVSAARALLARGRSVLMLDVGLGLEPELDAVRAGLADREPDQWTAGEVAAYRAPQMDPPQGVIRRYGSDFLLRDRAGFWEQAPDWLGLRPSFARGGLSNGWGSAVLPYRDSDVRDWPVSASDLAPHYAAVAGFMPVAGADDALSALFPAGALSSPPLAASAQAEAMLARIERRRSDLAALGVVAGRARQAARADCRRCGLCLHGCPYEYVFKASQVVDAMRGDPRFEYRADFQALSFEETADGVRVRGTTAAGAPVEAVGQRLFVGAGVLSTAKLLLASLGSKDEVELKDSQHLFLPLLHGWTPPRDPAAEDHHALAQLFFEVTDEAVSPHTVHAQLYTYNEFYALDMKRNYARLGPLAAPLFDALSRRLVVAQVFLHSDHSHRIAVRLGEGGGLAARLIENPGMPAAAARAKARIGKAAGRLGMTALSPASRLGEPGSSFHVGGSFPMRRAPRGLETDALGRPAGLSRVHLVDASTFPSVPATTITYTVMANAHRIGAEAP